MLATDGAAQQAHTTCSSETCLASVDDVCFSDQSRPMSRHCLTHIRQDTNQVLFKILPGISLWEKKKGKEKKKKKAVPVSLS